MFNFVRVKSCQTVALSTLLLVSGLSVNLGVAQAQEVKKFPVAKDVLPEFAPKKVAPGRDRFLEGPALTTNGLVQAIQSNRFFRKSLAKHFGLSESRLISFIKEALVPYILPKDTVVSNYGVTKGGLIYSKKMTLKKGTRVWATRDGRPILKWICSNPLLEKAPVLEEAPSVSSVSKTKSVGLTKVATNLKDPEGMQAVAGGQVALNTPSEPILVASQLTAPTPPIDISLMADKAVASVNPIAPMLSTAAPKVGTSGLPFFALAGRLTGVVRSVKPPKSKDTDEAPTEYVFPLSGMTSAMVPSDATDEIQGMSVSGSSRLFGGGSSASRVMGGGLSASPSFGGRGGGLSAGPQAPVAPEPGTLSLVGLGMALAGLKRLRRGRRASA